MRSKPTSEDTARDGGAAPETSVVVPAKDEAHRLSGTIEELRGFASNRGSVEIVLAVDPGSRDGTEQIARGASGRDGRVRVVVGTRSGKGSTVADGIRAARGECVLLVDADLSVRPEAFPELLEAARAGAVGIASRSAPGARRVDEPWTRFLLGRVFNLALRLLLLPGVRDTQCGFKALPRSLAVDLVSSMRTGGWVFDVEMLLGARRRGVRIREIPVVWTFGHGSSVRLIRDLPRVVRDLFDVWRAVGRVSRRPRRRGLR